MTDLSESPEVTGIDNQPSAPIGEQAEPSRRDEIAKVIESKEIAETPEVKAERLRDEQGKFTKLAKTADKPTEPPKAEEKPKRAYPKSWKKEFEKDFESIPEPIYNEISRREQDIEKGFLRIEQIKNFYDEMNQVINPYMPTINALGVKPAQAIQQLLNADHILRSGGPAQKQQYFRQLAKNYGVDLGGLQTEAPNETQLLREQIANLEYQIRQNQQQTQNANLAPYINEIEAFKAQADRFDEVRPIMAHLIESGKASDLKSAYDMAIRTLAPPIDLDQERKKWQEEEKQRIEKAKQAAVSVRGAPSATPSTNNHHDRRGAIEAAIDARSR